MEDGMQQFHEWYRRMMDGADARHADPASAGAPTGQRAGGHF